MKKGILLHLLLKTRKGKGKEDNLTQESLHQHPWTPIEEQERRRNCYIFNAYVGIRKVTMPEIALRRMMLLDHSTTIEATITTCSMIEEMLLLIVEKATVLERDLWYGNNATANQSEYFLVSSLSSSSHSDSFDSWLVASGASRHFTGYREVLLNLFEKFEDYSWR